MKLIDKLDLKEKTLSGYIFEVETKNKKIVRNKGLLSKIKNSIIKTDLYKKLIKKG